MIYHLTYRSEAVPNLADKEIEDILTTARNFNSQHNITGCLLFDKGFFIQLLEGKKEEVKELIDKIELDRRHTNLDVLSEGESEKRVFADWAIANYKTSRNNDIPFPIPLIEGTTEIEVNQTLSEITNSSSKENFTLKVFWYNVHSLLTEKGFYKN